ncbi:MAG: class I SAM-dependent methyltransferase [Saprospiraceae bacterium]
MKTTSQQPSEIFNRIDIYLFDQILKGRYLSNQAILDTGCGSGRNMFWFYHNDYELFAVDRNRESIKQVKELYPKYKDNYVVADLTNLPFDDNSMDHVINSAVLHFAESIEQFLKMFSELIRVLRSGGSLFIRMTSDVSIEKSVIPLGNGVFRLPDETTRFLLTRELLQELLLNFPIQLIEPFKTTNVSDIRAMSTLVFMKN